MSARRRFVHYRPTSVAGWVLFFVGGFFLAAAGVALAYFLVTVIDPATNNPIATASTLSAPTNVHVAEKTGGQPSATSLRVTWTDAATQFTGAKYEVLRTSTIRTTLGHLVCTHTPSSPSCTVSGLSPGTHYTFSVIEVLGTHWQSSVGSASFTTLGATTTTLPSGTVGSTYTKQLAATGGTGTDTWTLRSGTLPTGLSVTSSTGKIHGTPTKAGPETGLVFRATDAKGVYATSQALSITVTREPETTSTALSFTSPITYGSETTSHETFTAKVTGSSTHGYPEGSVNVKTSTTVVVCTVTLTSHGTDTSSGTCYIAVTQFTAGSYPLTAVYNPTPVTSSSNTNYSYSTSSTTSKTLVVTRESESSTTTLSFTTPKTYGSESETLSGKVSGSFGRPEGTVTVKATGTATSTCTTLSLSPGSGTTATYTCSLGTSALSAGTHSLVATYTPGSPSSSNTDYSFTTSSSTAANLVVNNEAPVVTTSAATGKSATGATLKGTVNDENNTKTTATFCYRATTTFTSCATSGLSTAGGSTPTVTGSSTTTETATLTGLAPNTTYYFELKGVSTGTTFTEYGSPVESFTTTHEAPVVTTSAATGKSATGATLSGTVNDENNTKTTATFCYRATTTFTSCATSGLSTAGGSTPTVTGSSTTTETATLTGLAPNTTYYFELKGVSTGTTFTEYGSPVESFTTTHEAPVVTTSAATGKSATGATLSGTVNDENNTKTTATFCYRATTTFTSCATSGLSTAGGSTPTVTGSSTTTETATLTGLAPNTTYYFELKGVSTGTTFTEYGSPVESFTTTHEAPVVTTSAATGKSATGATLSGTVNDENNTKTTATFCYRATTTFTSCATSGLSTAGGSTPTVTGSSTTTETATLTGLAPNTTYYFELKGVSTGTTFTEYGSPVESFTTTHEAPVVTTSAATGKSATGATLSGTVNDENNTKTTATFCYRATTTFTSCATSGLSTAGGSTPTVTGSSTTTETATLTGLAPNTTYYFELKGVSTGTTFTEYGSPVESFTTTHEAPVVTTSAATGKSATGATLNGTVNAEGTSTTVTFCYKSSSFTGTCPIGTTSETATQSPVSGDSTTAVSYPLTDLTSDHEYYFQVKATSTAGTTYGAIETFTTFSHDPTATTTAATGVTSTGATLNGTVNAEGTSTTVTFCYKSSSFTGTCPIGTTSETATQSPVSGDSTSAVSYPLTGLTSDHEYYFQVKATSTAGTTYGAIETFTTFSHDPTATTTAATNVGDTRGTRHATLNGTVNAEGTSTTVTFCYKASSFANCSTSGVTSGLAATPATATGDTATSVSYTLTGLSRNTKYYFQVEASSTAGTTYGSVLNFTSSTSSDPPTTSTLTAIISPVSYGAEVQTFTGHVTGHPTDGNPTGTVTVETTTGTVLCTTAAIIATGTDAATFTCTQTTASLLAAGTYSLLSHYAGGTSATGNYAYDASTSGTQTLTVTTPPLGTAPLGGTTPSSGKPAVLSAFMTKAVGNQATITPRSATWFSRTGAWAFLALAGILILALVAWIMSKKEEEVLVARRAVHATRVSRVAFPLMVGTLGNRRARHRRRAR